MKAFRALGAFCALALFVAGLAACVPPTKAGASGCGAVVKAGTTTRTIVVNGATRSYLLSVPPGYTGKKPLPVVFNFHGASSTMQAQDIYSQMSAKAGAKGWIVVTPQGISIGGTTVWVLPQLGPLDVKFVTALVGTVERSVCVDAHRVFAAGMSNGAGMSAGLLCAMPGTFAAAAPVAGVNLANPCKTGTPPASLIAFHGTADPIVPFNGGKILTTGIVAPHVVTDVAGFAAYDGCSSKNVVTKIANDVTLTTYTGCAKRTSVELYTITDGGHTWPGAKIALPQFGKTTQSIDATDLILSFFAAHPKV